MKRMVMSLTCGGEHPSKRRGIWTNTDGPSLLVTCVAMTLTDVPRVQFEGEHEPEELDIYCEDGFFYYDGVYYGDWVFELHDGKHDTPIQADKTKMLGGDK